MTIANYEVVGSGVSGASNTMASLWAATNQVGSCCYGVIGSSGTVRGLAFSTGDAR
jgi:hypothetical protein